MLYFVVGMASLWSLSEEYHEEDVDYEADGDQENIATSARSDQIVVAAPVPCPAAPARTAAAPRTRSKRARLNQEAPAGRNGRRAGTNEPSDGDEANQQPPPPPGPQVNPAPKLRSKAWDNFTLIEQPDPDQVFAQCKTCKAILRASSKNGTSHLLRHTANVHPHNTHEVNSFF